MNRLRHLVLLCALALAGCNPPRPRPMQVERPAATPLPERIVLSTPRPLPRIAVTIVPQATPSPAPVELLPAPSPIEVPRVPVVAEVPPPRIVGSAGPVDLLTQEGRALILEFETGGRSGYNPHPEWPAAASGVTIGIGYDLRFNAKANIRADWCELPARDLDRLVAAQGLSGSAAQERARQLRDITIPWEVAVRVFEKVTVTKFDKLCEMTWPGYNEMRGTSQDSLLSLTFNRGSSLVGESRRHMLAISKLSGRRDYGGMANQERDMIVIWKGKVIYNGMKRRRYAEAGLMEKTAAEPK